MAERIDEADEETGAADQTAAVAVALDAARRRGGRRDAVDAFLEDQRGLIADQRHHLSVQLKHLGLRYFADRLRVGLQIFVALGATAIGLFIAGLVWQAATDKGLVIEAFSTPPDLAARGLTGEVIAGQLEDKLSALQAATDSGRAAASYSNDWGHEIKVEIPETGVSISELQRYLRQWLGHETRIGGEVFHAQDGLRLTVRAGGDQGDTVTGPESDLDSLLQRGAEALFARTQPYRYAVFLEQHDRLADATAVLTRLADGGTVTERPWALAGLGNIDPDGRRALRLLHEAETLGPDLAIVWYDEAAEQQYLGQVQAAHDGYLRTIQLLRRADQGGMTARTAPASLSMVQAQADDDLGDWRAAVARLDEAATQPVYYDSHEIAAIWRAQDLARRHDVAAARAALAAGGHDADLARVQAKKEGYVFTPHVFVDVAVGDWSGALGELDALEPVFRTAPAPTRLPYDIAFLLWPMKAEALARVGRLAEAQALIGQTALDCDDCVRERGVIAALAGRPAEADRWFAEAARQAPRLPFAYLSWAQALLARGAPDKAIAELQMAHQVAPDFADPLELWGEALLRQGDFTDAVARFAEADRGAPRWGRNHLRLGEALLLAGRDSEARAQFEAANGMGLSAPERAALNVFLARTAVGPLHS